MLVLLFASWGYLVLRHAATALILLITEKAVMGRALQVRQMLDLGRQLHFFLLLFTWDDLVNKEIALTLILKGVPLIFTVSSTIGNILSLWGPTITVQVYGPSWSIQDGL